MVDEAGVDFAGGADGAAGNFADEDAAVPAPPGPAPPEDGAVGSVDIPPSDDIAPDLLGTIPIDVFPHHIVANPKRPRPDGLPTVIAKPAETMSDTWPMESGHNGRARLLNLYRLERGQRMIPITTDQGTMETLKRMLGEEARAWQRRKAHYDAIRKRDGVPVVVPAVHTGDEPDDEDGCQHGQTDGLVATGIMATSLLTLSDAYLAASLGVEPLQAPGAPMYPCRHASAQGHSGVCSAGPIRIM